ncbi:hypothetical protein SAMN04488057_11893 [Cyclobacterium lianum]|uniref:Uncharacterized protein n=1 Tax=Cyclobacterium lianum TaxID=388280 RepID=A0A1M7QI75_9BACT|nr:hypothetical protein SAMN04488057_11893 [Cyclobacterium lianum]
MLNIPGIGSLMEDLISSGQSSGQLIIEILVPNNYSSKFLFLNRNAALAHSLKLSPVNPGFSH